MTSEAITDSDGNRTAQRWRQGMARLGPRPDPADSTLLRQARAANQRGERDEALNFYRGYVVQQPRDPAGRCELAGLLAQMGECELAREELSDGLRHVPDNPDLLACRARVSIAVGDHDHAERDLRNALDVDERHAETHLELGALLSKKALWRHALPHIREAIELGGDQARAHVLLGEALNCTDDLAGALKAYERALELQPNDPAVLRGLGIIYDRLGRTKEAVRMYQKSRAVGHS